MTPALPSAPVDPVVALLPLMSTRPAAGFPSPAEDHYGAQDTLDLNQRCVAQPLATFFAEASGSSMVGHGIQPGDTLVVDRSLTARHGDVVVALHEGGFVVKELKTRGEAYELHSSDGVTPPIIVAEELDVWGVVTWSFHRHR